MGSIEICLHSGLLCSALPLQNQSTYPSGPPTRAAKRSEPSPSPTVAVVP
jgi:hypothetical protein